MSLEENKVLVRCGIEEVFNKRSVAAIDEFFAPNVVPHTLPPGVPRDREGYKQMVTALLDAFPDFRVAIEDMIAEGDKVVARALSRGTHKGEFMGIAPTGKQTTWTEIFIWRIEGGKAVEIWAEVDQFGLMQQLGVVPPPEEFRGCNP